jgi:superfamily II DNA or RNA helicase
MMFRVWLKYGIKRGWISPPYCMTHEGNYDYMTEEERDEWDKDGDPCHTAISVLI